MTHAHTSTSYIHPKYSSALKIFPCTLAPPGSGEGPTYAAGRTGTGGLERK